MPAHAQLKGILKCRMFCSAGSPFFWLADLHEEAYALQNMGIPKGTVLNRKALVVASFVLWLLQYMKAEREQAYLDPHSVCRP